MRSAAVTWRHLVKAKSDACKIFRLHNSQILGLLWDAWRKLPLWQLQYKKNWEGILWKDCFKVKSIQKWKLDQAAAGSRIFKTKEELNLRINASCSWQILCWIDNDPPTSIMPWLHYIWQTARLRTRVIWQQNSSIAEGGGCSNVSYRLQIRAWRFRNISLKQSKQHTYLQTLIFSHQSSIYQISATVVFDNCVTRAPSPRNAQLGHLDLVFSQSLILINGHLSRQWRLPEFISNIFGDYDNKFTNYLLVTSTRALRRHSSPPGPSFLSYFIFLCFTRP